MRPRRRACACRLLVRFPDILADRLARLQSAFARAIDDFDYAGGYTAIYPIKVNQQRGVVSELVAAGEHGFGLEAGSKPELMAVLAHARPGSVVVCNGYKDREYVRLALIGLQARPARAHRHREAVRTGPRFRRGEGARASSPCSACACAWPRSAPASGRTPAATRASSGSVPGQVLELVGKLEKAGLKHTLKLQHFHMGSQISNVRDIAAGMREAVRYFVELHRLGVAISVRRRRRWPRRRLRRHPFAQL